MNSLPSRRSPFWFVAIGLNAALIGGFVAWSAAPMVGSAIEDISARAASAASEQTGLIAERTHPNPLEVTPRAAFDALQARASGSLEAHWDPITGIPDFIAASDPAGRIPYTPSSAERGNPIAIARGFFDENRALFKLGSATNELQLIRLEPDKQLNFAHVRLGQVYRGLPVFGRQMVVHLDPNEQIVAVNGQFAPEIDLPTQPEISPARAEELALQDLKENQLSLIDAGRVKPSLLKDKTQLAVYVDSDGRPTLTWQVKILTHTPLGQWTFFIHARRPLVVHGIDAGDHIKRRVTFSARNGTDIPGRRMADEGERANDDVAQAAHDGAGKVYDYYFANFKRDGVDGQGSPLVSTVHYGSDPEDAENAAWIGEAQQMIYGDGGRIFRPLAYGLDVVGHEFTHGVVASTADLVYEGQSGALNESYADVFGVLIAGSNWTVGGDVIKSPPYPVRFLRSLSDPNAGDNYDARDPLGGIGQPADMGEYARLPVRRDADNGGVHINSGIPNRVAFLLAQAIGKDKMQQIYYRTLTQYLTPRSDFLNMANATARAAADLYGQPEVDAVKKAFGQVGINIGGADTSPQAPSTSPTPKRAPTIPTQPQKLPAGCTNIVVNGGFEGDEAWRQVVKGETGLIDPELPHTGTRSAWLGGQDQESPTIIYQDVKIPANATQVQLNYSRLLHEEKKGLLSFLAGDANFATLFANERGELVGEIEKMASSQGDDNWEDVQFDISQLAGKTLRLAFSAENPKRNISSFFVDDVSIVACTTGAGPAAPPTKSQDLVYVQGRMADVNTGRGVYGAEVYVLKPGLSATQAAADDQVTTDEVVAYGTTDANGFYQTQAAVPKNKTYSVIVIASGYRPIIADDGATIPSSAANPHEISGQLRSEF